MWRLAHSPQRYAGPCIPALPVASHSVDCRVYRTVKGATSFRVNKDTRPKFKLRWQDGYGVLTLRKDEIPKVSRYIDRQEEHHRRGSLSDLLERLEWGEDDWPEGNLVKPPEGG